MEIFEVAITGTKRSPAYCSTEYIPRYSLADCTFTKRA